MKNKSEWIRIELPDGPIHVWLGKQEEWIPRLRQWAVDNGLAKDRVRQEPCGHAYETTFGLDDAMVKRCVVSIRESQRAAWPEDARVLLDKHERCWPRMVEKLEKREAEIQARDAEIQALKAKLGEAERRAERAAGVAEEMRERAARVDPGRIRRELAAEFTVQTEKLSEENRALRSQLYEVSSQASKLAEDKKRLRSALNGARGGR